MYDTALLDDAQERVAALKTADIVIGLVSYRNARTIGAITKTIAQALTQHLPGMRTVLVNVDAASSDGTAHSFLRARIPAGVERFSTGYRGLTGAGSATRAVFEIAARLDARACLVLDSGLTGLGQRDVLALLEPILQGRVHLVLPVHQWSFVDAALDDLIMHPMVRLMYGRDVRRPMSGGWAVSGKLAMAYSEQDVWETDAARGGLDLWLLVMALAGDVPLIQVPSCPKALTLTFGTTAYDQRFTHSISTLLRHLGSHQRVWRSACATQPAPSAGPPPPVVEPTTRPTEEFWGAMRTGSRSWRRILRRILSADNHADLLRLIQVDDPSELEFDTDLWARIVLDFGLCFNKAELDPDKVAASLTVPYFARCLALWNQLDRQGLCAYDALIEEQALAFERAKPYFAQRWDSYVAWVPDTPVR
ncbi:MAG: hypothetical protein GXX93_09610 [Anaerolineae bacterium]|nr:hypothetical protein [Anaerolineae bacterium]